VHLEGPWISSAEGYKGAHAAEFALPTPDIALFRRWQGVSGGRIRILTLAPELPGVPDFIRVLAGEGVVISLGHTAASGADVAAAVAAGATLSTHLGNGAPAVLPRHPNAIWEQLAEDGLCASLIADGFHLPDSFLKTAIRVKAGGAGVVLVSDSAGPTGCAPGPYTAFIGGSVVLSEDGRLALAADPRLLAGSTLTLNRAVAHVTRAAILPLTKAVDRLSTAWGMASTAPARLIRAPQAAGLSLGAPADLVIVDDSVNVLAVYKDGRRH
jgi:N-acetylglucosamine-6-phosphate deacetylase